MTEHAIVKGRPAGTTEEIVTPKMVQLAERTLEIFEDKLNQCNYKQDEIEILLRDARKMIFQSMKKIKIAILWTIDLGTTNNDSFLTTQSKKNSKNLIDIFKENKIDIRPLGFYNLQANFSKNTINLSERKGCKPSVIERW